MDSTRGASQFCIKDSKITMGKNRSINLDLLRSIALLVMFVNHLGRFFPSISGMVKYTYSMFGIITSAEIFVAISAFAIFRSSIDKQGEFSSDSTLVRKAVKRFLRLYLVHVGLISIVIILSLGSRWQFAGQKIPIDYPAINKFIYGLVFLFQPALFDILPLYMFFTLLNPILIRSIKLGIFKYLCGVSFILWLLVSGFELFRYERFTESFVLPFFHLLAWQFLYCCLLMLFSSEIYISLNKKKFMIGSIFLCAGLISYAIWYVGYSLEDNYLTSRAYMGPLRLLSVLSWSALVLSIGATWELSKLSNIIHWIGRNSLQLFSIHVIIFHINKFYIHNSAYYWTFYPQVFTYLALVFLPYPLVYLGGILRERFRT